MIEESPNRFRRNEAMGVFDSVLGLMADLHDDMEDRGVEGKGEVEWGERTVDGRKRQEGIGALWRVHREIWGLGWLHLWVVERWS